MFLRMSIRTQSPLHPASFAAAAVALVFVSAFGSPLAAQITTFDESAIHAVLTGPGQNSTGECAGRLIPSTGALALACSHDVAGGQTAITRGRLDEGGTILFNLGPGAIVDGDFSLTSTQTALLITGGLWVTVTSNAFPLGEVTAKLLPAVPMGEQLMRFPLTNEDMVQTPSPAQALCALRIRAGSGPITLLCVHDVPNPVALQLLIDGGVVKNATGVQSPFQINMPELRNNFNRFLEGDFGVRLTSNAFPNGELGRVLADCIAGPNTLCLTDNRFRVTVVFTAPNQPQKAGKSVPASSADSGLFWFFSPANWEVLVKVLNACPISPNYWVFISANTNVAFTVTITDMLTGRTRTYSNAQGHVADTVADTDDFPCQG